MVIEKKRPPCIKEEIICQFTIFSSTQVRIGEVNSASQTNIKMSFTGLKANYVCNFQNYVGLQARSIRFFEHICAFIFHPVANLIRS